MVHLPESQADSPMATTPAPVEGCSSMGWGCQQSTHMGVGASGSPLPMLELRGYPSEPRSLSKRMQDSWGQTLILLLWHPLAMWWWALKQMPLTIKAQCLSSRQKLANSNSECSTHPVRVPVFQNCMFDFHHRDLFTKNFKKPNKTNKSTHRV